MPRSRSANAFGPEYSRHLAEVTSRAVREASNDSSDDPTEFKDDDSHFTTETIDSAEERGIYGNTRGHPDDDDSSISSDEGSESGVPALLLRGFRGG